MSAMPRYTTGSGTGRRQDESAARCRGRPAHVHRDLGLADLPAAARAVLVRVDALGRPRAVVVDGAPELSHVLDHHAHAVGVALAEVSAARVVGPPPAELDRAAGDVVPA